MSEYLPQLHTILNETHCKGSANIDTILNNLSDTRQTVWTILTNCHKFDTGIIFLNSWSTPWLMLANYLKHLSVITETDIQRKIQKEIGRLHGYNKICFQSAEEAVEPQGRVDLIVFDNYFNWFNANKRKVPWKNVLDFAYSKLNDHGECFIISKSNFRYESLKRPFSFFNEVIQQTYPNIFSLETKAKTVGFKEVSHFLPHPSLTYLTHIIPWENRDTIKEAQNIKQVLNAIGIGYHLNEYHYWSLSKNSNDKCILDEILHHCQTQLSEKIKYRIERIFVSGTKSIVVSIEDINKILRIPLADTAYRRLKNGYDAARELGASLKPELRDLVPVQHLNGKIHGIDFFLEQKLPGIPCTCIQDNDEFHEVMKQAVRLLGKLSQTNKREVTFTITDFKTKLEEPIENVLPFCPSEQENLDLILSYLQQSLIGKKILFSQIHGDFNIGNILINPETRKISGLIDWDRSNKNGLAIFDFFSLLLSRYYLTGKGPSAIGSNMIKLLLEKDLSDHDVELTKLAQISLGIDTKLWQIFSVCYCILHNLPNITSLGQSLNPEWMQQNFHMVIRKIIQKIDTKTNEYWSV